ncbi:MAG: GNAT family N-acetyltransferase [Bacteroidota bacterium]
MKSQNIRYQFSPNLTIDWLLDTIPNLLFPNLAKQRSRLPSALMGIVASWQQQPVGLVVANAESTQKIYRIHSLCVHPNFRRKGIATTLLDRLEKAIGQFGGTKIEGLVHQHWTSFEWLRAKSQRLNWTPFQPKLMIVKGKTAAAAQFLGTYKSSPSNFNYVPFNQLTRKEVQHIQDKQRRSQWFDSDLHPFLARQSIATSLSFLVKKEGVIIGWLVTHQLNSTTTEITSLFLDRKYTSFRLAHFLLQKVFSAYLDAGIPKFVATSKVNGNPVLKLLRRAATAGVVEQTTVYFTEKEIL